MIVDDEKEKENIMIGVFVGILITVFVWFFAACIVEGIKVETGYLTYQGKVYKVELYSELKYPKPPVDSDDIMDILERLEHGEWQEIYRQEGYLSLRGRL